MTKYQKNIRNKKKNLILFDLDGVLINSIKNMEISWDYCKKKYNLEIDFSSYKKFIGLPFNDILKNLKIRKKKKLIKKTYNLISINNFKKISLYPNTKKYLKDLNKKNLLGIVTSKDYKKTIKTLKYLKINNFFSTIVCPSKNLRGKPYPDQLIHAMKVLEIKKKNTIYVGDVKYDQISAKKAGIKFFYAEWGYGFVREKNRISNIGKLLSY